MDSALHVVPIPALADNYIWLVYDDNGDALVIDPGEAAPVHVVLREEQLTLRAILLTHHHPDHIGGADELRQTYQVPVYAPVDERISLSTQPVTDGDEVVLDAPVFRCKVISVPGHTLSHVVYAAEGLLFCGDTLFSLGCGRVFEGTSAQMCASLRRIADLPGDTLICCGHEYTANNARFALSVDPDNAVLLARSAEVDSLRASNLPSVPATLASEQACNPFLRLSSDAVMEWCRKHGHRHDDAIARFASLRAAKDAFRA